MLFLLQIILKGDIGPFNALSVYSGAKEIIFLMSKGAMWDGEQQSPLIAI